MIQGFCSERTEGSAAHQLQPKKEIIFFSARGSVCLLLRQGAIARKFPADAVAPGDSKPPLSCGPIRYLKHVRHDGVLGRCRSTTVAEDILIILQINSIRVSAR